MAQDRYMTKDDIMLAWERVFLPYCVRQEREWQGTDEPEPDAVLRREAWNNMLDGFSKMGLLHPRAEEVWLDTPLPERYE